MAAAGAAAGCGGGDGPVTCEPPPVFEPAMGDGHPEPLGAGPGEARAGRLEAHELPVSASGLAVWAPGDFVLANDRIAVIIEDVGPSDGYDPWGGRPVGIARVEGGALVEPAEFLEPLVLLGRQSVVTTRVEVVNDGSDGKAAVVRASGPLAPVPFFEALTSVFADLHRDIPSAIEYVLEPGAEHVDVWWVHRSPRTEPYEGLVTLHGFLYTPRMPIYTPGNGFSEGRRDVPWVGFIDDDATSFAYSRPGASLDPGIFVSGFSSFFSDDPFTIDACAETRRLHARLTIGGPGLDGLLAAVAREQGAPWRTIAGTVTDGTGAPAAGVRVHVETADGAYLTRDDTDARGAFEVHVPPATPVRLTAFRRGDAIVGPVDVAADATTASLSLPATGRIEVTATDADTGAPLPVRVQVLPAAGEAVGQLPEHFGDPPITGGRLHVAYAVSGTATVAAPPGTWEVVVSRGYEYEIHRETVTVASGATVQIAAMLERVVDTTGMLCADYHIHTHRSADSGDDAREKIRAAVADGLEIPVRSEHEFVEDFQPIVEELGLDAWARGITSVELTSMELWGHMGVLPLEADPGRPNGGAPLWQRFPTERDLDVPLETLSPPRVFAEVRARPEAPIIIINHPRGWPNYFDYVGLDRTTGLVDKPEEWDEEFQVVEIFNDSGWLANRNGTVADWLTLLDSGRRIFAVGSSDSHGVSNSPVGYPRTCLYVGTDDPRQLTPAMVRDATQAGRSTISGGIYVEASVLGAGPGQEVTGAPSLASVRVRVQAARWVDVDAIDVVVDGETVETIPILPGDADPANPVVRYDAEIPITIAPGRGSYVIVAAYGDSDLSPVHPRRLPFGVTNPIFLR